MVFQHVATVPRHLSLRLVRSAGSQVHSLASLAIRAPTGARTCASLSLDQYYASNYADDRLESLRGAFKSRRFHPDSWQSSAASAEDKTIPDATEDTLLSSAQVDAGIDQVTFGELLSFLEAEYGLAPQCVQESLLELAEILGYSEIGMQTPLNLTDAGMLMEEVGAPACTSEEVARFRQSRTAEDAAEDTEETVEETVEELPKVEEDGYAYVLNMLKAGRSHMDEVYVSRRPKLRRW